MDRIALPAQPWYMLRAMSEAPIGGDRSTRTRRPPFGYMLAALLAFAAAYSLGGHGLARLIVAEVSLAGILVTGLLVCRGRITRLIILVFGLLASSSGFALIAHEARWLLLLRGATGAVFLTVMTALVMRAVVRNERVTGDKIVASVCGYLLLGTCWSIAYALIEAASPGAFALTGAGGDLTSLGPRALTSELAYFSFVTLTTLGYGDITPISPQAQTLAWMEAGAGQIYLTVLVARLVGLHIVHSQERPSSLG